MSNFSFYESHVVACIDEARQLIDSSNLQLARSKLESARSASEELQREIFLMPTNDRAAAQRTYDRLQAQITEYEKSIDDTKNRQKLLGGNYNLRRAASVDEHLAHTVDLQEESNEIGIGILSRLKEQRDTLNRSAEKVDLIHNSVNGSGKILGEMEAAQRKNKLIMWSVVGLLVLSFIILFYIKEF